MANDLSSRSVVLDMLKKHSLHPKKRLGQNFLTDGRVVEKIISAAGITKEDTVAEIGPGLGALTAALAKSAGRVYAIEVDGGLIPVLKENLSGFDNVEIINSDILKFDLSTIPSDGRKLKVTANLPYYITTPIIFGILENRQPVSSMTVMVQREVGERLRAKPSTKEYGALTLAMNYYADVTLAANVPPNCFIPRPDVDSAVMQIDVLVKPRCDVCDPDLMFKIIKAAFSKRRKTLLNCLASDGGLGIGADGDGADIDRPVKGMLQDMLSECGLPLDIRGEALALEDFAVITNKFKGMVL